MVIFLPGVGAKAARVSAFAAGEAGAAEVRRYLEANGGDPDRAQGLVAMNHWLAGNRAFARIEPAGIAPPAFASSSVFVQVPATLSTAAPRSAVAPLTSSSRARSWRRGYRSARRTTRCASASSPLAERRRMWW